MLRLFWFNAESRDFELFLSPWYEHIVKYGGLKSLLTLTADYNLPYQYIMLGLTYLPIKSLYAIKLVSVAFDYLLAYMVYKIVGTTTDDQRKAVAAGLIALAAPTLLINSAGWAQSDSIYTALLLASLYFVIKNRPAAAMWMYTLSFGFKIQAIFFGPIMIALLFRGFFKKRHLAIPALYYLLLSLPVVAIGGKWSRIVEIAMGQINIRNGFSFFLPNIFYLFNADNLLDYLVWKNTAIALFAVLTLFLTFLCWKQMDRKNTRSLLVWTFIFALVIPFTLVRMHERYYLYAEFMAFILVFIDHKKYLPVYLALLISSMIGYITVFWWIPSTGITETHFAFVNTMTHMVYPVLSITIISTFALSILKEFNGGKPCNIEPIK